MSPKICLTMIVRNEADILERCVYFAGKVANRCVIVDTGSTDHTPDYIELLMENPCPRFEWRDDFSAARNYALKLAGDTDAEWLMFLDADEISHVDLPDIEKLLNDPKVDLIGVPMIMEDGRTFPKALFARNINGWKWINDYHEDLTLNGARPTMYLVGDISKAKSGPYVEHMPDGARSKAGDKNANAEKTLQALWERTGNPRHLFYLGDAQMNQGKFKEAYHTYQACIASTENEVAIGAQYICWLQSARAMRAQKLDPKACYQHAIQTCPSRAEAPGELAVCYANEGNWAMAYVFALACSHSPEPRELEYVEAEWRAWRGLDLLIASLLQLGRADEALSYSEYLMKREGVPDSVRNRVIALQAELTKPF